MPHNLVGQIILDDMFSAPLSSLARLSQQAEAALRQMGGTADTAAGTAAQKIQALEATLEALRQKAQSGGTMTVLDVNQFRTLTAELERMKKTMEKATTIKVESEQAVSARQRLAELEKQLDDMRKKAQGGQLSVADVTQYQKLSAEANRLKSGLDQATAAGKGLLETVANMAGINLGPLTQGLTAAAAAFVAMKVATEAFELYKLGTQAVRIENAFASMASSVGSSAAEMLDAMRKAARGTINDVDLMMGANKAMMLSVTNDAQTMGRLLEVAIARGHAMGRTPAQAFDDIVTGLGRISPRILDNIGILTGGQAAYNAYAESIGKTWNELTDFDKRQFLVNKVLADTTVWTADAQMGIERVGAAWQNFRNEAGAELSMGGGDLGIPDILDRLTAMGRISREARTAFDQLGVSVLEMAGSAVGISLGNDQLNQWAATYRDIARMVVTGDVRQAAEDWTRLKRAMEPAQQPFGIAGGQWGIPKLPVPSEADQKAAEDFANALENAMGQIRNSVLSMSGILGGESAAGIFESEAAGLQSYARWLEQVGITGDQASFMLAAFTQQVIANNRELKAASTATSLVDEALKQVGNSTLRLAGNLGGMAALGIFDAQAQQVREYATALDTAGYSEQQAQYMIAGFVQTLLDANQKLAATKSEAELFAAALDSITKAAAGAAESTALGMTRYLGVANAQRLGRARAAEVAEITRSNRQTGNSLEDLKYALQAARDRWEDYDTAVKDADHANKKAAGSTNDLKRALTALEGKIKSALSMGLEVTPADMLATKAGTYKDTALESARRLNAIAERGFAELRIHPDWVGMLKIPPEVMGGAEEQLRAWAASTSASVQDFSRPDLINWDAFIANFQAQLDKEQAQKLTVDIAVNKLDEAGLLAGLGEDDKARRDKVAEALGLKAPKITLEALIKAADKNTGADFISETFPPKGVATISATLVPAPAETTTATQPPLTPTGTTTTGAALAGSLYSEFTTTIAGQDVGAAVYTAWNTSLTAPKSLEDFGTIGTALGTTVAGAFVTAVKDGVGNVRRDIASIVAPEVAKILANQQPRTNLP